MKQVLFLLLIVFSTSIYAQSKQDYHWILGQGESLTGEQRGYSLDFNEQPYEFESKNIPIAMGSMNSSISSKEGELLFYTNGCFVYNRNNELMENGDSINFDQEFWELFNANCTRGYIGPQDVLIIPDPSFENQYVIFHKPFLFNSFTESDSIPIFFSNIKMNYNNGLGKVMQKDQRLYSGKNCLVSYLTGIQHADSDSYWLIQPIVEDSTFITYLIDSDGFHKQPDQSAHQYFDEFRSSGSGTAKFSPDGTKYALYNYYDQLHIYDFDRETGLLSNHQKINIYPDPDINDIRFSSVEWSSSSRFIYTASKLELHQIDTWEQDIEQDGIRLIDTYNGTQDPFSTTFFLMAQAPDCRIYMCSTNGGGSYHVINSPNEIGIDCDFVQNGIKLPNYSSSGALPNFPRFRVDEEEKCDPTIVSVFGNAVYYRRDLVVYPSPSTGQFTIELPEGFKQGRLVVTDINSQVLRVIQIDHLTFGGEVQLVDFPEGIYNIEIYPSDNKDRLFYSKQVVKI